MKAVTKKILFGTDIVFALFGLVITIMLLTGTSIPAPVIILALVADASFILDGSALIMFYVRRNKLRRVSRDYDEEYDEEDEDEE